MKYVLLWRNNDREDWRTCCLYNEIEQGWRGIGIRCREEYSEKQFNFKAILVSNDDYLNGNITPIDPPRNFEFELEPPNWYLESSITR